MNWICILYELFHCALYYLSFLIPRSKKKWIFSTGANAKYLFWELQSQNLPIRTYLISNNLEFVKRLHEKYPNVLYAGTWKARFHLLTSKLYFCTVDTFELSFDTSGGATIINLWHGVGIKKMGAINNFENEDLAYKRGKFRRIFNMGYLALRPTYLLSTSAMMNKHFSQCFELKPQQLIEAMYPRCQFMLQSSQSIIEYLHNIGDVDTLNLLERFKHYEKVILYMPTWRDSNVDIFDASGFDFKRLDSVLNEKNYFFVLKLHPNTPLDVAMLKECKNVIALNNQLDLYPILPFTSMLITDYSSIYYDYLLLENKEIMLFPYDEKEYIANCRDFAFDYSKYTPGVRAYSFQEMLQIINEDISCYISQRNVILDLFWGKRNDLYSQLKEMYE